MERQSINSVSIALKPNVYNTFRNLNNTVSNTLGEYVDNAVQSYLDNKERLLALEPSYRLHIGITIDWEFNNITIEDNAAGIDTANYLRAFEPAHIPLDDTGLNEFGMGMKTASVWLADNWSVATKALGEDVERYTEFDLHKVTTEEKENLVVKEILRNPSEHYTRIELSHLSTNAPKRGQLEKIRRHLSSIYRYFLRSGQVDIVVNGDSLVAPSYKILCTPYYKTPNGNDILWKREIDFCMGGYKAKGFIAILDKIQNGANGLVLMRRGRVIVGGGDERYFPFALFGQSGNFRYRRLFGELELEGFDVSFNKNGFREEDDLYLFMEALKDELKTDEFNLLSQADNYRQRGKDQYEKISKAIKNDLEKKSKPKQLSRQVNEVENKISNTQYLEQNEERIKKAKPIDSYKEQFKYKDEDYVLSMELVTDTESDALYSVIVNDSVDGAFFEMKSMSCKINLAHPFFTRFEQFKKAQDYAPVVEIFKALALAEIMAKEKGTTFGSNIRMLFNQYILQ